MMLAAVGCCGYGALLLGRRFRWARLPVDRCGMEWKSEIGLQSMDPVGWGSIAAESIDRFGFLKDVRSAHIHIADRYGRYPLRR